VSPLGCFREVIRSSLDENMKARVFLTRGNRSSMKLKIPGLRFFRFARFARDVSREREREGERSVNLQRHLLESIEIAVFHPRSPPSRQRSADNRIFFFIIIVCLLRRYGRRFLTAQPRIISSSSFHLFPRGFLLTRKVGIALPVRAPSLS